MGLLAWWRRIRSSNRFDPRQATDRIPAVTIRPLREEDIPECHAIYRGNETGRFPDGYFSHFEADLQNDGYLWLIVEQDDELVAVGGVTLHKHELDITFGLLTFGMVAPDRHKQGFGSALLLARIAAVSRPDKLLAMGMTATPASVDFYKRYGFRFAARVQEDDGLEFDSYYTLITRDTWGECRALLKSSGVRYDPDSLTVPVSPLSEGMNA